MGVRSVHLIGGQSGAIGTASKADLTDFRYDVTQNDVRQFARLNGVDGSTTSAPMTIPNGSFSIEAGFGYRCRNELNEQPVIIRFAGSGYGLLTTFNPDADAELAASLRFIWACREAMKTEFPDDDVRFASCTWIQGERDAQITSHAAQFREQLVQLGTVLRGELGWGMPLILTQLSEHCGVTTEGPGDLATVRAAVPAAAAELGNAFVVDRTPVPLQGDEVHDTADGLMMLSDLCFEGYASLQPVTPHPHTARAFDSLASAQAFATLAQSTFGDRSEDPSAGGFGARIGSDARDPWPTTPRSSAVEAHPYHPTWYVPIDGAMRTGEVDVTTNARRVDLEWLEAA